MPDNMREELMEVARSNNFIIKYDKYDWNLHLAPILKSQVCSGYIVYMCQCVCACVRARVSV